ncbi:MAG: MBL fold metallo-hydrolase [Desulfurococcales archaeon]|nr:MBL fold metallo-hydrolase [Desulfurococcales archaeon]
MQLESIIVADVTPIGEGYISAFILLGEDKTAIVDPGSINGYEKLKNKLESLEVRPDYIIPTHVHIDHGGASCKLARDYPRAKILVHPRGVKHLIDPSKLWNASKTVLGSVADVYGQPLPCEESMVFETKDRGKLDLGGLTIQFIHTPGHASHHQSIWIPETSIMLSGDSAGAILATDNGEVFIPTTPPPFKPDYYISSVEKMIGFTPQYIGPTHYGIYGEALKYLEEHLKQIKLWVNIALDVARSGHTSPEQFLERIKDTDDNAIFFLENENPIVQGSFIYTTAVGLMDYAVKTIKSSQA